MKPAISINNISKLYRIGASQKGGYRTLRESISDACGGAWRTLRRLAGRSQPSETPPSQEHWALKDVSFDVKPGAVVGIIGRNGAGKSTLLKVLSRITEPTEGSATVRGRLGSLLEVGTGFHYELTGRENIYLNGAVFGMSRREIDRKFDAIVAFSEVGPFLDTPVKRYSSGMFVRLAFAVASHMEPEILLVDEVLAVGDAAFQKKCLGKLGEVGQSGRTVLFVSHNMATILNLCDQVAVLDQGRLTFMGDCEQGISHYMNNSNAPAQGAEVDLIDHPSRRVGKTPILGRLRLLNSSGRPASEFLSGESITVELGVVAPQPVHKPCFAIGIEDSFGCRVFTVATYMTENPPTVVTSDEKLVCRLDELPLCPGRYCVSLNAGPLHGAWTDALDQVTWFDVVASDFYRNGKLPDAEWGRFLVRSRWHAEDA
jgi:lipopolysaccharide transport system ATP-binding protein